MHAREADSTVEGEKPKIRGLKSEVRSWKSGVYTKKLISLASPIHLIASRRETNRFLNENFKSYLSTQVKQQHKLNLAIEIKSPSDDKCLQVTDFVCWSLFRKREYGDESYFNVFKKRVIEESALFP